MNFQNSIHFRPLVLSLILSLIFSSALYAEEPDEIIESSIVGDRFGLYIHVPEGYHPDSIYSLAIYMDANLKMGKELRRQISLPANQQLLENVIFVGIGHIGNYRTLRRRDFIPPVFTEGEYQVSKTPDFGHADQFYRFLTSELIPGLESRFQLNGRYSIIGHSFSGLFSYYCLFRNDAFFKNHIALSPSLWVNYDNIFEIEKNLFQNGKRLKGQLYHACGSWEWTNKVRSTSRKMSSIMTENHPSIHMNYSEFNGRGHHSMVPIALEEMIEKIQF